MISAKGHFLLVQRGSRGGQYSLISPYTADLPTLSPTVFLKVPFAPQTAFQGAQWAEAGEERWENMGT